MAQALGADKGVVAERAAVPVALAVAVAPGPCFCGEIRPVVECSGYTCCHLPDGKCMPDWFKRTDAMLAIFAARMAFSSLVIRSRLR